MAQNREPPAFQEYAAAMMAKTDYRLLSLAGRGLLYTMRLECWVNRRLPPDAPKLARVLGFEVAEVAALTPEVQPFFDIDAEGLFCPELENYRASLDERRARQAEGGRQGAAKTNGQRSKDNSSNEHIAAATGKPQAGRLGSCESLIQSSPDQSKTAKPKAIQALKEEPISDEWMSDYERASRGQ